MPQTMTDADNVHLLEHGRTYRSTVIVHASEGVWRFGEWTTSWGDVRVPVARGKTCEVIILGGQLDDVADSTWLDRIVLPIMRRWTN